MANRGVGGGDCKGNTNNIHMFVYNIHLPPLLQTVENHLFSTHWVFNAVPTALIKYSKPFLVLPKTKATRS